MTGWSTTAPPGWGDACAQQGSVFHSDTWHALLAESFPCSSLYFSDDAGSLAITQFRAGPFRIGYLGFPVGGVVGQGALTPELLERMRADKSANLPVALRIAVSGFGSPVELDLPYEATAETSIVDLQSWTLAGINKNRRRDVNRSLRSGLTIADATAPVDGTRLYELYRATLERKDGSLRYSEAYFRGLITMAQTNPRVRVLLARDGESIAAFTVVVRHGSVAYYLHGAFDWAAREHMPSAMLLNEAIEWSKAQGSESFNLMSSPPGQQSLIDYKERWGAETREHRTYTLPLTAGYPIFKMAEGLYRRFQ